MLCSWRWCGNGEREGDIFIGQLDNTHRLVKMFVKVDAKRVR